ncbi:MAG TPA: DUF3568 family protein [Usitatibacter sp.]|nr:DUF3568 family protein [Usitatibacter sp.]
MKIKKIAIVSVAVFGLGLGGCVPVALTALGVGMATGVSHELGGMVYKTFTAPQAQVKQASFGALHRMQIKVVKARHDGSTETITAKAADREIEIELEALTPATTRMMVTATKDGGVLRDSATATEIILQTERYVGNT